MKNPLAVLISVVSLSILLPILISSFAYSDADDPFNTHPNNDKLKNEYSESTNEKIIKNDKNNKKNSINTTGKKSKTFNYEKVDKNSPKIKVYNHLMGKSQDMDLEEYLCGVLSGEMPSTFTLEALKAQAVAARTYVIHKENKKKPKEHPDAVVCTDFAHCQEYKSPKDLEKKYGKKWMKNSYSKIKEAVAKTKGHILTYNDSPILPLYFSTSSGKTENSEEVFADKYPYLRSVESKYDNISPKYQSEVQLSTKEFINKLSKSYNVVGLTSLNLNEQINIKTRSKGGAVEIIKVGNKDLTGRNIREVFKLNSANFELNIKNDIVNISVKGYGHGVGMSQWGAEGMAKEGHKYSDILLHYYTGAEIKDIY